MPRAPRVTTATSLRRSIILPFDRPGQHDFEAREPGYLDGLSPKGKRVSCLKEPAEYFERGHGLQGDRKLFGVTIRQAAMNDLNLQPGQTRGRPGCVVFMMLVRQASSPSESQNRRGSNTPVIER